MNISRNILTEIQRRANKMEIPDDVLYSSEEFGRYFQDTANTVLSDKVERVRLHTFYDPDSEITGFTDGNSICINTANAVANHDTSQEGRFLTNLGLLFHECAHILYTDFEGDGRAMEAVRNGQFWPVAPNPMDRSQREALLELSKAMQDPQLTPVIVSVVQNLQNIIADAHDEACICSHSGSMINNGINAAAMSLRASATPLETMVERNASPLNIMLSLILQYVRFYDIIVLEEASKRSEYGKKLQEISQTLIQCRFTDDTEEKMNGINQILLTLWPYLKEALEQQRESEKNDPNVTSGPNGISEAAVQRILSQIQQAVKDAGQSASGASPQNRGSVVMSVSGQGGSSPNRPSSPDLAAAAQAMGSLKGEIAHGKAEKQVEQEMASAMSAELSAIPSSDLHQGAIFLVSRPLSVTGDMREQYQKEYATISTYVKVLTRKMRNLLREQNDDGYVRRNYGKKLKAQDAYRKDQKYFFDKKLPSGMPSMSVAVLADQSGSMTSGSPESRLDVCRRAAIMLEAFSSELGIPVMVAGHNAQGSTCKLHVYVPFDRGSASDKYRLMQMSAGGCNRDGLALSKVAGLMMKRSETVRLLFLISDGRPSSGPTGEEAYEELRTICKKAERNGIQVFAAGIGGDQDILKHIYGSRFLDVSDMSQLPKLLIKMVQRRIMAG